MNIKKNIAAKVLKTSPEKVHFAEEALGDISKAITRSDIRGLIAVGKISRVRPNHQSRVRARENAAQKSKGRRKGKGTKKGRKFAVITRKEQWMTRVRLQRLFLKELRDKELLSSANYRMLYNRSKGGYFRNKRHVKLFITEQNLIEAKNKDLK